MAEKFNFKNNPFTDLNLPGSQEPLFDSEVTREYDAYLKSKRERAKLVGAYMGSKRRAEDSAHKNER